MKDVAQKSAILLIVNHTIAIITITIGFYLSPCGPGPISCVTHRVSVPSVPVIAATVGSEGCFDLNRKGQDEAHCGRNRYGYIPCTPEYVISHRLLLITPCPVCDLRGTYGPVTYAQDDINLTLVYFFPLSAM